MSPAAIWTVFRKDLMDITRDRKTLMFMLLFPMLIMPATAYIAAKLAIRGVKQQAVEEVTIVADAATQDRYIRMVHAHFAKSGIATVLRWANSPIMKAVVHDPKSLELLEQIPPNIFTDPKAYEAWAHTLATQARNTVLGEGGKVSDTLKKTPAMAGAQPEIPATMLDSIDDFYRTTIRNVGLVKFVRVEDLDAPALNVPIPAVLAGVPNGDRIYSALVAKKIQGSLVIPPEVDDIATSRSAKTSVRFYHISTNASSEEASRRIRDAVDDFRTTVVEQRLSALSIGPDFLRPITFDESANISTKSQIIFAVLGGFVPYLVVLFAYLGGLYPALDLGAGEKERNTLETLLLSPLSRSEIALGKYFVILFTSLSSAVIGAACMGISFWTLVPAEILEKLDFDLNARQMIPMMALAIPPAACFAGIFLSISIYARTFREAQNYVAPLGVFLIIPSLVTTMPGVEMNWKYALIPLVNVSLLGKEFIKGDVNWYYYALTTLSSCVLAAACVALCIRQFHRESVLFRS
ncbi:hypothetical protein BH09SUM1_BH09SUM1_05650 [soil metagenome]